MKASLKILAVLFSITLASVAIYVIASRDVKNAEAVAKAKQIERDQAEIAKHKAELKALVNSGRQDIFTFSEIEKLKRQINKLEGNPVTEESEGLAFEEGSLFGGSKSGPRILLEGTLKNQTIDEAELDFPQSSFDQASENGPVLFSSSKVRVFKLKKLTQEDLKVWENLLPQEQKKLNLNEAIMHSSKSLSPAAHIRTSDYVKFKELLFGDSEKIDENEIKGYLRFFQATPRPFEEIPRPKYKVEPQPSPKPRLHSSKYLAPSSSVRLSDIEKLRELFLKDSSKKETKKPK